MKSCIVWIAIACSGMPDLSSYDVLGDSAGKQFETKEHPPRISTGPHQLIATPSYPIQETPFLYNESANNNNSHIQK